MIEPSHEPRDPCASARAAFAGYLRDGTAAPRAAALRRHLRDCAACRDELAREVGGGAAGPRGERLRRQRAERRTRQRGLALAGAFQGWTGGVRGARLRLLLVPALAIVLMTEIARGPRFAGEVRAEALAGSVWVDAADLPAEVEPRSLRPGEGCATGGDGRARLGSSAASVELAPHAQAWLEAHQPARFRLGPGEFLLSGDLTATTRWGVLECAGARVEVRVERDGFELEVLEGRVRCIDHRGERVLARGARARLP